MLAGVNMRGLPFKLILSCSSLPGTFGSPHSPRPPLVPCPSSTSPRSTSNVTSSPDSKKRCAPVATRQYTTASCAITPGAGRSCPSNTGAPCTSREPASWPSTQTTPRPWSARPPGRHARCATPEKNAWRPPYTPPRS